MWVKGQWIKQERILNCLHCSLEFKSTNSRAKYCSSKCRWTHNSSKFNTRHENTRYLYLSRLLKDKHNLTIEQIETLFAKQKGLCALSGVPLTWVHGQGKVNTNLSLDRINHGQEYSIDNIRLVCVICNVMRLTMEDTELMFWCKQILETNKEK